MKTYVKALGYYKHTKSGKNAAKVKAHLKYIEQRPNDLGEREKRELFNEKDAVSRKDFQKLLDDQEKTGVIAHKLCISMNRKDMESGNIDLKELTRQSMAAFEAKQGRKLNWIATIHDKDSNPHIHIVVAGRDTAGREVRLGNLQVKQLKNCVDIEQKRERERNLGRSGHDTPPLPPLEKMIEAKAQVMAKELEHSQGRVRGGLGGPNLGKDATDEKGIDITD